MNCPGEGFVGKDCQCKCPTNDPNNPIQPCTGTAASTTTTAAPPTSAPTNGMAVYIGKLSIGKLTIKHLSKMLVFYLCNVVSFFLDCSDMNMYCSYWAGQGYCETSRYMMMYCKESCRICNGNSDLHWFLAFP